MDFFSSGKMPFSLNLTDLILIPKVIGPEELTHFRPISLCNFLSKVVSKVLANRLKSFLSEFVSKEQGAFVPGRVIQENIDVAHEAFHFLKRKKRGRKVWCAVKTNMMKACDRVSWCFLEKLLRRMGFVSKWIGCVMECVSRVSYHVMINEKKLAAFKAKRGL